VGSHFTPSADPSAPVTLRPQGFTPSRRLAPPTTCRACFISVPPMGLTLRGFAPPAVPYALSDAVSLMGFVNALQFGSPVRRPSTQPLTRPRPSRARAHCQSPARRTGVKPARTDRCLLGLGPLQGLPRPVATHRTVLPGARYPSRALKEPVRSLIRPLAPQGLLNHSQLHASLSRPVSLHGVSHLVAIFGSSPTRPRWRRTSSGRSHVAAGPPFPLLAIRLSCRSSPR
jgi:hypothetical protein